MGTMASQITSLTIVYSAVYSGTDQRKHQSPASLAFVRGIHRGPVNSSHKGPVTRKILPFDDVIMCYFTSTSVKMMNRYASVWPREFISKISAWDATTDSVSTYHSQSRVTNSPAPWPDARSGGGAVSNNWLWYNFKPHAPISNVNYMVCRVQWCKSFQYIYIYIYIFNASPFYWIEVSTHGQAVHLIMRKTNSWTFYRIRKIVHCACTGNVQAGNVFPTTDFKGNR